MSKIRKQVAELTPEQRLRLAERLRGRTTDRACASNRVLPAPSGSFRTVRSVSGDSTGSWTTRRPTTCTARTGCAGSSTSRRSEWRWRRSAHVTSSLRTTFSSDHGRPVIASAGSFALTVEDVSTDRAPLARIARWAQRNLDTSTDALFAACLWRLAPDHHILSLLAHHLVCDGWSISIIERELSDGYRGAPDGFHRPSVDYADFVEWERSREEMLRARLPFWGSTLAGVSALRLPADRGTEAGEVSLDSVPTCHGQSTTWPRVPAPRRSSC